MDISQITEHLYVGAQPCIDDAEEMARQNVRLIISMMGESRPEDVFCNQPFRSLWVRTFDTFFTPITDRQLTQGVEAALDVIRSGGSVFVHCYRGRHRSVIMAAAILIAQGHSAREAIALLRKQRSVADPDTWYVRRQIHRFEKHWRRKNLTRGNGHA